MALLNTFATWQLIVSFIAASEQHQTSGIVKNETASEADETLPLPLLTSVQAAVELGAVCEQRAGVVHVHRVSCTQQKVEEQGKIFNDSKEIFCGASTNRCATS